MNPSDLEHSKGTVVTVSLLVAGMATYRWRVTTKAWLDGDQYDLQDLAQVSPLGDLRVVREGKRYYLTAPEIDNPPAGKALHHVAEQLIVNLNGFARVKNPSFRSVRLSGTYENETGQQHAVDAFTGELRLRARMDAAATVGRADGTVVPDQPSPWPDRWALTKTNSDVARVVDIMGRGEKLDWFALYKVYEIIERAIKPKTLRQNSWTTKAKEDAFTASANNFKVSGAAARHAIDKGSGYPKNTMTIEQGRSFISDLAAKWLASL